MRAIEKVLYDEKYYHAYDTDIGKVDYKSCTSIIDFMKSVAQHIVDEFHPKTVLDAGCAMGHLVAALRDLGVEAYGVDISEYAIANVREDISPYCAVGSLAEPLPEQLPNRFDLVVSIEVMEHLYAEDGVKAIGNLCKLTNTFLFCSTPDDIEEPTHRNVQQREYWARIFGENGFFDDLASRPTFLAEYAVLYKKNNDVLQQIVDYERNLQITEAMLREKTIIAQELARFKDQYHVLYSERQDHLQQIADYERNLRATEAMLREKMELTKELTRYKDMYYALNSEQEDLKQQLADARNDFYLISNAFFWKISKPIRFVLIHIKKPFHTNRRLMLICKGLHCFRENGMKYTWNKVKEELSRGNGYASQASRPLFSDAELDAQRKEVFAKKIKFSIVVPLFNTPTVFLHEMIRSVIGQTYADWELCMADGSDKEHSEVNRICMDYCREDSRIRYRKLEQNKGISGNTNACLEMITGDYIGLFDHDDLLHPAALHEVMVAICEKNADFIYTDENTFHLKPADAFCPHYKPDYAPDTLRANNYICHFTVFAKNLLTEVGMFRRECDGSQDYDMVLRLTEKARAIVHIPEILYYWRAHSGSVAESVGAKPYAIEAAHRGVEEHLKRIGLKGEVLDSVVPSIYRLRYEIHGEPLISILIPSCDHIDDLQKCLDSIFRLTTYPNFEVIIIENNSNDPNTFTYYEMVKEKYKNLQVVIWNKEFNYSAINNYGANFAKGEHILLLNNDTEVISPDWLQEMLMYSQRSDVGAVGAKLYYPDDTIQHAGVGIGLLTLAGHYHRGAARSSAGYMGRLVYAQDLSAVTGACLMLSRSVWHEIGGLDETFPVAFNDVDMCMRVRKAGYLIVWTPYAELYHYESKSRGAEDTPEKKQRFRDAILRFQSRWKDELAAGDPYFNPNFSQMREDFFVE